MHIATLFSLSAFLLFSTSSAQVQQVYERDKSQLQARRLAHAQQNLDPDYHRGPAFQARGDIDELMRRMQRREAIYEREELDTLSRREPINAEFYKKTGVIKELPGTKPKCKSTVCTPEEMKKVIAWDKANFGTECKKLSDCKCPGKNPYGTGCLNGKCMCGDAMKQTAAIGNAFAKPVLEGMKKFGEAAQKIMGNLEAALKLVVKIGSWAIPGLGPEVKIAMKALDAALPPGKIATGDVKADEVLNTLNKFI